MSSCNSSRDVTFKRKKNNTSHVRYPSRKGTIVYSKKTNPSRKKNKTYSAKYNTANSLVNYAQNYIGVPYAYAGKSPSGFDCSGYTSFIYNKIGIKLPPASKMQSREGQKIKIKNIQKGDLIFFGKNNKVSHVGIVVKKDNNTLEVIHATSSRGVMQQDVLKSNYWRPKMLYARRMI